MPESKIAKRDSIGLSGLFIRYLIILLVILVGLFSYVINQVYEWGSDDSVHYFMQLAAEQYIQADKKETDILHVEGIGKLEIYPTEKHIPPAVLALIPQKNLANNQLEFYETGDKFIYLLPYQNRNNGELLYVINHYYLSSEDTLIEQHISHFTLQTIAITTVSTLLLISLLVRTLILPIKRLSGWSQNLETESRPIINIKELDEIGQQIEESVAALSEKNEREKQFLKSLSHELRTPLAITKASIELLEKTETNLSSNTLKKLSKIKKANDSMCATSDTLLWLWSGELKQLNKEDISITDLIHSTVSANQYLIASKDVSIHIDLNDQTIKANRTLVEILIRNLIRNAFQYTPSGNIDIELKDRTLKVSNTIGASSAADIANDNDYGFGVGLYLTRSICESQSWAILIDRESDQFCVSVTFNHEKSIHV